MLYYTSIWRNEWRDREEALSVLSLFKRCAVCDSMLKYQHLFGHHMTVCTSRKWHMGVSRYKGDEWTQKPPKKRGKKLAYTSFGQ